MVEAAETVLKVKEIMLPPLTVDINKTGKYAGDLMRKNRRYSLIVTKKGNPVGILTDSDLIKRVVALDKKPSSVKVSEMMSAPIVTVGAGDSILSAAEKMKKNKIKRLPVMEKGKIVGMIELTDVARASPEMVDLLEYKIKLRDMTTEITEHTTSGICESCGNYSGDLNRAADGSWVCGDCLEEMEE